MSVEPNDTIFEATESDLSSEETPSSISSTIQDVDPDNTIAEAIATGLEDIGQSVSLVGEINNSEDVDIYRVQLDEEEVIVADIDIMSLGTRLRLFDESGNELNANFTNLSRNTALDRTGGDPFFTFVTETAGNYYIGVSIFRNPDYDPINPSIAEGAFIGNSYELKLDKIELGANNDLNTTIAEAIDTELDELGESASFNDALNAGDDVDIYQVQLDAGEGITIDLDAAEFGSDIDSRLRLFDALGNVLTANTHTNAPGEERGFDSYLTYTARTTADYYIGVSSFRNSNYDPVNGKETNLPEGEDYKNGSYQLNIDLVEPEILPDPDDSIPEAIATGLENPGDSIIFNDEISIVEDIDIYQVQLDAGEGVNIDIDAEELNSNLNSRLRLFDAEGNEIANNTHNPAPGEESSTDSYLSFIPEFAGVYYFGVSDISNDDYDPNEDMVVDFVAVPNDYKLEVSLFEVVPEKPEVGDDTLLSSFDSITGTDNPDTLFGNAGSTFIDALAGDDVLTGGGNSDYLLGGAGSDILSGNNGDDTLIGGNGFDVLSGGEGNDFLQGDEDSNILFGGEGADIFVIGENTSAENTISDFEFGIDKIQLDSSSSFWDLTIEDIASGSGVAVSLSLGHGVTTILGVNSSNLSTADFLAG